MVNHAKQAVTTTRREVSAINEGGYEYLTVKEFQTEAYKRRSVGDTQITILEPSTYFVAFWKACGSFFADENSCSAD